jgi:pimeloyl-ACP methyl ester carboxylesterase
MNDEIQAMNAACREYPFDGGTISALHYIGHKQKILMLHGNSSCKEIFSRNIPFLVEQGHAVLAPDFPGHGDSENARDPASTYSFPGYAETINALLVRHEWTDFIVVGWSLGGHVALELVANRPDCKGAMLIGSPPGKPSPEALEQAFFANDTTLLAGKNQFDPADVKNYVEAMLGTKPADPFFLMRAGRTDGRAREMMFISALAGVGIDQRTVVSSRFLPVAVVLGADDPFVRRDYLTSLTYGRLWRKEVAVLEGAGHAPHWQAPVIFNELLKSFIVDIGSD